MYPGGMKGLTTMEPLSCIIEPSDELGGLYLGNLEGARNVELLKQYRIRAVLTAAEGTGLKYTDEVVNFHEVYMAKDLETYDMAQFFEKGIEFIERCRNYSSVLVHCFQGVSRSASIILVYFMKMNRWTLERALEEIRSIRPQVSPNIGFLKQMKDFEKALE